MKKYMVRTYDKRGNVENVVYFDTLRQAAACYTGDLLAKSSAEGKTAFDWLHTTGMCLDATIWEYRFDEEWGGGYHKLSNSKYWSYVSTLL